MIQHLDIFKNLQQLLIDMLGKITSSSSSSSSSSSIV